MGSDVQTITGYVLSVSRERAGSAVTQDALAGTKLLYLDDASDFAEEGGSIKLQNGATVTYDSVDMSTDVMTLTSNLTLDVPEDTYILTYPVVTYIVAQIEIESYEDPITVRVPHHYWAFLPLGQRNDDTAESAKLWYDGDDWSIVDVGGTARVRIANDVATSQKTFRYTSEGIGYGGYLGVKLIDPYAGTIDTARIKLYAGAVSSDAQFDVMVNDASVATLTIPAGSSSASVTVGYRFTDGDKIRVDFTDPADATASPANPLKVWLDVTLDNG